MQSKPKCFIPQNKSCHFPHMNINIYVCIYTHIHELLSAYILALTSYTCMHVCKEVYSISIYVCVYMCACVPKIAKILGKLSKMSSHFFRLFHINFLFPMAG